MDTLPLSRDAIAAHNATHHADLQDDHGSLGRQLERRGIDINAITGKVAAFTVALPSWGTGRGGTRFARFPLAGEPTNLAEKLDDLITAITDQTRTLDTSINRTGNTVR